MNPLDRAKEAGMKRAMKSIDVRDHPLVGAIAEIIAKLEHEQARALASIVESADMDVDLYHDVDERQEELLDLAEAVQEQDLERMYFEDLAAIDSPSMARQYVGLDADEWREQIETWYTKHHDAGTVDVPLSAADRADVGQIAAMHVEQIYGVSLQEFVAGVVNFSEQQMIESLLAGNIRAYTSIIRMVAGEIEDREQRIDDLQEERDRLQERVEELEERNDG